jgi:hypothetical protein
MRRLLALAALGGLAAWLVRHRRVETPFTHVSVGFGDGSSETLPDGSPERELLVAAAEGLV